MGVVSAANRLYHGMKKRLERRLTITQWENWILPLRNCDFPTA